MHILGKGLGGVENLSTIPIISLDVLQNNERDLGAEIEGEFYNQLCYSAFIVKLMHDILRPIFNIGQQ